MNKKPFTPPSPTPLSPNPIALSQTGVSSQAIVCRRCKAVYSPLETLHFPLNYCTKCAAPLKAESKGGKNELLLPFSPQEKPQEIILPLSLEQKKGGKEEVLFEIDHYQVNAIIKQGGMGEVLLAYDPICSRNIALKRVRADLLDKHKILPRFMREAKITSQLTHPSIMPIYQIHWHGSESYYTMPYVEGENLGQILRRTLEQQKKGEKLDPIGGSLPALLRIYIQICQAVAYAHSKGVLHRDLKPDNILIGKYGEVLILDWGLVTLLSDLSLQDDLNEAHASLPSNQTLEEHLTSNAFPVGTSHYISPERLLGQPASLASDIYALGVIFYRMLTLEHPFKRGTLSALVEKIKKNSFDPFNENYLDADLAAPYRDVPNALARIARKCLDPQPSARYQRVDQLLAALNNYMEGKSDWIHSSSLNIAAKEDWEFQEHVLIAQHVAITRGKDSAEWVLMMVSKQAFEGNTRLEAEVTIGEQSEGIGLMLCIPEPCLRSHINEGYCLWMGSEGHSTRFLRSTMEIMHLPDVYLRKGIKEKIRIEKVDNHLSLYINDALHLSYISHTPMQGNHIGIVFRDANFTLSNLSVYLSSQSVTVSCLAVPDAFLAKKDYVEALAEYRKISASFPGRSEGREAMFRSGFTLIEQAKREADKEKQSALFDSALEEFNRLTATGAPLEFLGKALVYQQTGEFSEEIKCFELAHRRYPHHPLMAAMQEQLLYRMHESACVNRTLAYEFMLLSARYLQKQYFTQSAKKTFSLLEHYWEPLWFIETTDDDLGKKGGRLHIGILLAFWLAKPYVILELIEQLYERKAPSLVLIYNAYFSLLELGCTKAIKDSLALLALKAPLDQSFEIFHQLLQAREDPSLLKEKALSFLKAPPFNEKRAIIYLLDLAVQTEQYETAHLLCHELKAQDLSAPWRLKVDAYLVYIALSSKKLDQAQQILQAYPLEMIQKENNDLYPLYGCWLAATAGKEAALNFFSSVDTAYPQTPSLLGLYLQGKIQLDSGWIDKAFLWEKRQFYRYLIVYYRASGDHCRHYQLLKTLKEKEKEQYVELLT